MRRKAIGVLITLCIPAIMFAGGIVTNTNQSASFIRMPALDAIIGVEGVYYNPAGLVKLNNGLYISLNNQYVTQKRTIESTFPMNQQKFEGDVLAPLFPTFYAVYKKDKLAYSFGVNPIGGGGSANFTKGLPSFEQPVAAFNIPLLLTASGIPTSNYGLEASLDGSSLNWGFQANVSYAINDMISVSLGLRYIVANNSYKGGLKISINPMHPLNPNGAGNMVSAPLFFNTLSTAAAGAANNMQPILDGGGGDYTLAQLVGANMLSQEEADQLSAGLGAAYDPAWTAAQVQGAYQANAAAMSSYASLTADKELDAKQSGTGISPIIGLNLKLAENFNVALKYEHKAEITMTNATVIDNVGLYPDGDETPNDMPSLFSAGLTFKPIDKLSLSGGFHYYFDKSANYGKKVGGILVENTEVIDKNYWEASIGLEYMITDKIFASAGYLLTQTGVNSKFQSDMSHSLNTNSIGLGGKYLVTENLGINIGFMTTMYKSYTKDYTAVSPAIDTYSETYNRSNRVIAIGVDYKF